MNYLSFCLRRRKKSMIGVLCDRIGKPEFEFSPFVPLTGTQSLNDISTNQCEAIEKVTKSDNIFTGYEKHIEEDLYVIPVLKMKENNCDDIYKMTSRPRGYCLIMNNDMCNGTSETLCNSAIDNIERLAHVFRQLEFNVLRYNNQTTQEMFDILIRISLNPALKLHDALALIILSHGDNSSINGTDGSSIKINDILNIFNDYNCILLKDKPKLFFFNVNQECDITRKVMKGNKSTYIGSISSALTNEANIKKSNWNDIFICQSNVLGSTYGYILAKCLAKYAYKEHLIDIVSIKVALSFQENYLEVNGGIQPLVKTQTVGRAKQLYFNPGY